MNKTVIGVVAVVIVLGAAFALMNNSKDSAMMEQKAMEEKAMMEKKAMEEAKMMEDKKMEDAKMMDNKDGAMMEKKDGAIMKGSYEAYSPEKVSWAEHGKVVLFFKASWCPTCKALDSDIKSHLANIPEGTFIFEVDYDNSADLKKKYGVTTQHTLVQVDAKGNMINKWSGGNTLDALVKNIK